MAVPTNTDYTTAIEILSLPYSITQRVDDAGVTYNVWYKYTAVNENCIGGWGFGGAAGSGYRPRCDVYTLVAGTPTLYPQPDPVNAPVNVPFQMGVTLGETYYFKFTKNGNFTPSNLTLNFQTAPDGTITAGSILVNDDSDKFPLAIISSADGDDDNVIKYLPFVAGEFGDVIASENVYLFEDQENENVVLYAPNLQTIIATINIPRISSLNTYIRTNQFTNKFWTGQQIAAIGDPIVRSIDADGNSGTLITLASSQLNLVVANDDDTILYISPSLTSGQSRIKTWDISGNAYGSDLVANIANYSLRDMLLLGDGSLLALYFKLAFPRDLFARRYDAAGATLSTHTITPPTGFTFTSSNTIFAGYRLAFAIDNPNSYWVWYHCGEDTGTTGEGFSFFRNVKVSDGSTLSEVIYTEYEIGVYQRDETTTPSSRFGISQSCPFVILRGAVAPPASGMYRIRAGKRQDTLWLDAEHDLTKQVKIPDPFIKTGLIGR